MFKLMMFNRPFEKFDVANPQHRLYYKLFEETGSWRNCPYQWIIEDDALTVPHYIQKELNEYYWKHDEAMKNLERPSRPQPAVVKTSKVKYFGNQTA